MENSQIRDVKNNKDLKLAPETIRIRDAIVEEYLEVPLDKLSSKLQSLISEETNTVTRLGILSARVEILRKRFAEITGRAYKKDQGDSEDGSAADEQSDEEELEEEKEGWMTLRILEASEVNGVRFPEGVKIDVHTEDAKKLITAKKAELLSMQVEERVDADQDEIGTGEQIVSTTDSSEVVNNNSEGVKAEEVSDLTNNESELAEGEQLGDAESEMESPQTDEKPESASSETNVESVEQVEEVQAISLGEDKQSDKQDKMPKDNPSLNPEELQDLSGEKKITEESEETAEFLDAKEGSKPESNQVQAQTDNTSDENTQDKTKAAKKNTVTKSKSEDKPEA